MEKDFVTLISKEPDEVILNEPQALEITLITDSNKEEGTKEEQPSTETNSEGNEAPEATEIPRVSIMDYFDEEDIPEITEELSKLETIEEKEEYLKSKLDEKFQVTLESTVTERENKVLQPLQKQFKTLVEGGVDKEVAGNIVLGYKNLQEITKEQVEEDIDTAKKIYTNYLKLTTSFSKEKIEKQVAAFETNGTLTELATEAYDELKPILKDKEAKELKAAQDIKEAQIKEAESKAEEYKAYIENIDTLGGIKVTPKMKQNLIKASFTQNGEDPLEGISQHNKREFNTLLRFIASNFITYNNKTKSYSLNIAPAEAAMEAKATQKIVNEASKQKALEMQRGSKQPDKIDSKEDIFNFLQVQENKFKTNNR